MTGDMRQIPYCGPTRIRRNCTNFGRSVYLAPEICASLVYGGRMKGFGLERTELSDRSGKAIPIQAWTGLWGSRRLTLPEVLDSRHMQVVRLLALRTGRLYPKETSLVLFSVRG
jgi:hypothetical protein